MGMPKHNYFYYLVRHNWRIFNFQELLKQPSPFFQHIFYYHLASNHTGGVNAALSDGSVTFISETIDCGNPADLPGQINGVAQPGFIANDPHQWTGPTSYGVYGAAGSMAGGESKSL